LLRTVCTHWPARAQLIARAAARLQAYRWDANAQIVWQCLFPQAQEAAAAAPAALPVAEPLAVPRAPRAQEGRAGAGLGPALGAAPQS
jgi:hypothetical protein